MNVSCALRRSTRVVNTAPSLSLVRTKASLIPPNISSLKELGKLESQYPQAHPELFAKMKSFYANIPKGPSQKVLVNTFAGRYYEKYIEGSSAAPVLHFLAIFVGIGYTLQYFVNGTTTLEPHTTKC
ncbi:hypothetical protein HK096_005830 [Nowakowskiella sp. JEL0078]|nr:hypothetical protein HK096_005830 [Nowakowskiella sp. JEL0078]